MLLIQNRSLHAHGIARSNKRPHVLAVGKCGSSGGECLSRQRVCRTFATRRAAWLASSCERADRACSSQTRPCSARSATCAASSCCRRAFRSFAASSARPASPAVAAATPSSYAASPAPASSGADSAAAVAAKAASARLIASCTRRGAAGQSWSCGETPCRDRGERGPGTQKHKNSGAQQRGRTVRAAR